jgi:hypothetical protein
MKKEYSALPDGSKLRNREPYPMEPWLPSVLKGEANVMQRLDLEALPLAHNATRYHLRPKERLDPVLQYHLRRSE